MVRTEITPTQIDRNGVAAPTVTAGIADGHMFVNAGRVLIEVLNNDGSAQLFTMQIPGDVDGEANTDKIISIGAGLTRYFGPFPVSLYNQPGDKSRVYIDYAAAVEAMFDVRIYQI